MFKLVLRPDADGYNRTDGTSTIVSELDGGAARYRQDKIGATSKVNVKWTLTPEQYRYWRAFYVTGTKEGALAFRCDLVSEDGQGPVEQVCNFVPGSVSLPTQQGFTYVQTAILEVIPPAHNTEDDIALITAYEEFGEIPIELFNQLAYLVNVQTPAALNG